MDKSTEYERYKSSLSKQKLTDVQYQILLKKWCDKHGY